MPNFFIFQSTSKFEILAQNLDYEMALSGPKIGIIDHKKFQGFQKWDKISKKTFKSDTSPKPA